MGPWLKPAGRDVTFGVGYLKLRRSIGPNSEGSPSYPRLIDQNEPLSPDLLRKRRRLCVDGRRTEVPGSEATDEPSGQGHRDGEFAIHRNSKRKNAHLEI